MVQQVQAGLNSQLIDRPRHAMGAQAPEQGGTSRCIAQPQTGNGITLGQGVEQQHVGINGSFGSREQGGLRKTFVGLVNDKTDAWILLHQLRQLFLRDDLPRRIVGIAEP